VTLFIKRRKKRREREERRKEKGDNLFVYTKRYHLLLKEAQIERFSQILILSLQSQKD